MAHVSLIRSRLSKNALFKINKQKKIGKWRKEEKKKKKKRHFYQAPFAKKGTQGQPLISIVLLFLSPFSLPETNDIVKSGQKTLKGLKN